MIDVVKCVSDNSPVIYTVAGLLIALLASPWVLEGSYYVYAQWERKRRFPNSKYIAVFLSTGQVYFGTLNSLTRNNLNLGNIFYLQNDDDPGGTNRSSFLYDEENQSPRQGSSLVKLGEELHGPEDLMLINRQHIAFIEHLSAKGQVVQAIEEYIAKNTKSQ